jgi:WD40 repeat protein
MMDSFTLSPDGLSLVAGGAGDTLTVWDVLSGKLQHTIRVETELEKDRLRIRSPRFSPNGRHLAALVCDDFDGAVRLWDTTTWRDLPFAVDPRGEKYTIVSIAFAPDGRTLAAREYLRAPKGTERIRLWEVATGQPCCDISERVSVPGGFSFSPDGRHLAATAPRSVVLWDTSTGKCVRELDGHRNHLTCVAFSPDGRRLLSCGYETSALIWDVSDLLNRK